MGVGKQTRGILIQLFYCCFLLIPKVDEKKSRLDERCLSRIILLSQVRKQRIKSVLAEQAAWGNAIGYRATNEMPHSCWLARRAYSDGTRPWECVISMLMHIRVPPVRFTGYEQT